MYCSGGLRTDEGYTRKNSSMRVISDWKPRHGSRLDCPRRISPGSVVGLLRAEKEKAGSASRRAYQGLMAGCIHPLGHTWRRISSPASPGSIGEEGRGVLWFLSFRLMVQQGTSHGRRSLCELLRGVVQGSLLQCVMTPGDKWMPKSTDEIAAACLEQVRRGPSLTSCPFPSDL